MRTFIFYVLSDNRSIYGETLPFPFLSDSSEVNGSLSMQLIDRTQAFTLWNSSRSSVLSWGRAVIYTGRISGDFQVCCNIFSCRHAVFYTSRISGDLQVCFRALSVPSWAFHSWQFRCFREVPTVLFFNLIKMCILVHFSFSYLVVPSNCEGMGPSAKLKEPSVGSRGAFWTLDRGTFLQTSEGTFCTLGLGREIYLNLGVPSIHQGTSAVFF